VNSEHLAQLFSRFQKAQFVAVRSILNEKYGEKKTNGTLILVGEGKIQSIVDGMDGTDRVSRILKEFMN